MATGIEQLHALAGFAASYLCDLTGQHAPEEGVPEAHTLDGVFARHRCDECGGLVIGEGQQISGGQRLCPACCSSEPMP